jgi:hypothetical protein
MILTLAMVALAGTLIEDFDDGDAEGWERSPQNEDSKVFWGVEDGAMMFDPKGLAWDVAISQMNFVGTSRISNVRDWTDYDVEVDIKLTENQNYPGGVRGRVDLDTGGHYVVWLYPASGEIKLYKNPGWDINTGIATVGSGNFAPKVDEYHKVKLSMQGDSIKVYYDDKLEIDATDKEHKKGTIAVGSQDRVVYFDNIIVTGSQIPNHNMSPVEPMGKITTVWGQIKVN